MDTTIFRKKSIDKVSSPEDLNSYLRVTNPPIWFALSAVIIFLIGAIIWGTVAKLETKADGLVLSQNGETVCYISEKDVASVENGTLVRIGDDELHVTAISASSVAAGSELTDYCMSLAGFEDGEYIYSLSLDGTMSSGNYPCKIVLESVSPISFLFNSSN